MSNKFTNLLMKIKKANAFLKVPGEKKQNEIVKMINKDRKSKNLPDLIQPSTYSAYVNADEFKNGINQQMAWKLFLALHEIIERDFKHQWDDNQEDYVSISTKANELKNDRIDELCGAWEAFSWDYNESQERKEGYVHGFKIKIEEGNNVTCSTEWTVFERGQIYLIGIEKVCIEFSHPGRKLFFLLHIGSVKSGDIKRRQEFKMVYSDSGQYTPRAGLATMRRVKDYDSISCGSKPVIELETHWPGLEQILKDKQYVLSV